ncbi:hypothetical protein J1605_006019 [Eschrichtius robustus]|uniref:Protein cramped-like n=1 Tax=Eschrichtius robustus TaxID=9764 RepID=A0AB34H6H1_ESCRO|nr:hypothetical protein J1605_006019 [Eschrichtius robustus]
MVLSLEGADGGGSSTGNGSGVAPAAPAGGSRSSSRNLGSSGGEKEEGKKVRRQWESWSTEDKNTFFEGLYEHGKDFEAIQNNIALKYKKKGKPASMVKNKEQVRHFYYRTWHKITKYIDFDNVFSRGLKKSSQELYGLICYGELRKKIGGSHLLLVLLVTPGWSLLVQQHSSARMDDKNATKLNELIQAGEAIPGLAAWKSHRALSLRCPVALWLARCPLRSDSLASRSLGSGQPFASLMAALAQSLSTEAVLDSKAQPDHPPLHCLDFSPGVGSSLAATLSFPLTPSEPLHSHVDLSTPHLGPARHPQAPAARWPAVLATTVRYKGRNLRIKAPMCRALKKLCDPDGLSDEEDQKPVRLPLKVPVELQPRNNHAWARVQSLAQNPRLRMIVELHRKVSSLIEFLKQKWALHEVRVVSFSY